MDRTPMGKCSKPRWQRPDAVSRFEFPSFLIRICFGFRISDFGFWVKGGQLPPYGYSELFAKAVFVKKLAVGCAVFVDQAGDLDIVATILGNLQQTAFPEPPDSLHPFSRFLHAEGRRGH